MAAPSLLPPAAESEVRAVASLRTYSRARRRFSDLGLDVSIFASPFARWLAARALTDTSLNTAEHELLLKSTDTQMCWADAIKWLAPADENDAVAKVDALVVHAMTRYVPEQLRHIARVMEQGKDVMPFIQVLRPVLDVLARSNS